MKAAARRAAAFSFFPLSGGERFPYSVQGTSFREVPLSGDIVRTKWTLFRRNSPSGLRAAKRKKLNLRNPVIEKK